MIFRIFVSIEALYFYNSSLSSWSPEYHAIFVAFDDPTILFFPDNNLLWNITKIVINDFFGKLKNWFDRSSFVFFYILMGLELILVKAAKSDPVANILVTTLLFHKTKSSNFRKIYHFVMKNSWNLKIMPKVLKTIFLSSMNPGHSPLENQIFLRNYSEDSVILHHKYWVKLESFSPKNLIQDLPLLVYMP